MIRVILRVPPLRSMTSPAPPVSRMPSSTSWLVLLANSIAIFWITGSPRTPSMRSLLNGRFCTKMSWTSVSALKLRASVVQRPRKSLDQWLLS